MLCITHGQPWALIRAGISYWFDQHRRFLLTKLRCYLPYVTNVDIVCMQETHRGPNHRRPFLKGMKLLAEIQHGKYGSAIFSRPDLPIEYTHTANSEDDNEIITVRLCSISNSSVYKPGSSFSYTWPPLVIRDFNSHNTMWGYNDANEDGALMEQWAETYYNSSIMLSSLIFPKWPLEKRI